MRERMADAMLAAGRRWPAAALELGASAVVFAPHPDDEVLGCGGTIALKRASAAHVHVAIMTDGRTSHASLIDANALIAMRRAEALEASRALGLDPSSYTFLEFEDGRLADRFELAQQRVGEVLRQVRPEQVFVPHRLDRLRDHVATYDIVRAAVRESGRRVMLLEYPVWLWNSWPWTCERSSLAADMWRLPRSLRDGAAITLGCRVRVDVRAVLSSKRRALDCYRSQTQRHGGDPRWPVLSDVAAGTFVDRFFSGTELFRASELGGC
jgi:LmbE family N-acetylglucosaminyl deacetylase